MDIILLALVVVTIAIYAMIDIANRGIRIQTKVIWFPVVILLPLIGLLCYFFMRKSLK